MNYEYLLRRIYQVGRYGVAGADADIFRALLMNYTLYNGEQNKERKVNQERLNDLDYDYRVSLNEVWDHLQKALHYGNAKFTNELTDEEKDIIEPVVHFK